MAEPAKKPDEQPKPNAEAANSRQGGATVTVGCRLPFGYVLETYTLEEDYEQVMGGGSREVKVARKTGHRFALNGNRVRIGQQHSWAIVNGAGLTRGVPEDVWEAWLRDHKNEPIVKNRIIFAHARENEVRAMAKEARSVPTGLEPINPSGDPRKPQPPKGERVVGQLEQGNKDEDAA